MRGSLIIAFLLIALAAVTKCKGELYEIPVQFETGKASKVEHYSKGTSWRVWTGKTVVHGGLFDPPSLGEQCVLERFEFRDRHVITMPEMLKFLAPYGKQGMSIGTVVTDDTADYAYLIDRAGNKVAVLLYRYDDKTLSVMTNQVWTQVYESTQHKDRLRVKAQTGTATQRPQQPPAAQPQEPPTGTSNDCMIVATEMYKRLKPTAVWCRIAQFRLFDTEGKFVSGHAAVFYAPTEGSTIFMYDKRFGSLDLHTQSHELDEILIALNLANMRAGYPKADEGAWVGQ